MSKVNERLTTTSESFLKTVRVINVCSIIMINKYQETYGSLWQCDILHIGSFVRASLSLDRYPSHNTGSPVSRNNTVLSFKLTFLLGAIPL